MRTLNSNCKSYILCVICTYQLGLGAKPETPLCILDTGKAAAEKPPVYINRLEGSLCLTSTSQIYKSTFSCLDLICCIPGCKEPRE